MFCCDIYLEEKVLVLKCNLLLLKMYLAAQNITAFWKENYFDKGKFKYFIFLFKSTFH